MADVAPSKALKPETLSWHTMDCFRAYRLTSVRDAKIQPVLRLNYDRGSGERPVDLPNGDQASWLMPPCLRAAPLRIGSNDLNIEALGLWASVKSFIRSRLTFKRKKYLQFDGFKFLLDGPRDTRALAFETNKLLGRTGTRPDSPVAVSHPELLIGWGPEGVVLPPCTRQSPLPVRIAIVIHIYYVETWPEIAVMLKAIPYQHDLIITLPPERESLTAEILSDIPSAIIRIVENRGRDVRPFLVLLEDGTLDKYDYICKIHSKRSRANDPSGNLGDICRRRTFFDMLVAPGAITTILQRFTADTNLGMIGSRVFRLRGSKQQSMFWRHNRLNMQNIIRELGGKPERVEPDFFEGTMFWVRTRAFDKLRDLRLSSRFLREQGAKDGALEHAIERIFATSVTLAGYRIEDTDALSP